MRIPGQRLHDLFAAGALAAPDRVAVCAAERQITYGELNRRADRLARRLSQLGVGPEALVALCVDRGIEMVVGALGILKAGGAYVPVEPGYPAERIHFLLDDSAVSAVVASSGVEESLTGCGVEVVWIDREGDGPPAAGGAVSPPLPSPPTAGNLAYVIYTSGSTGAPKGVMIEHANVVRLFEQTHSWSRFDHQDVWTLCHSVSFDFSVWEIWGALLYGGRLVIVPGTAARAPAQLLRLLETNQVTVLNQTPSAFRQLLAAGVASPAAAGLCLRFLIFGGERLEVKLLQPWIARFGDRRPALVNMYGITETTVHVTYRRILAADLEHPEVSPIGLPIPDLQVHLLDAAGQEVPDGTPGDIYVGGPGLARGYLNRPELTAARFIRRAVAGGEPVRLYHSGDRACRTPDGQLAYLGRSDDQMKVRGFRIEPGEIETCLAAHPAVETAVVTPHDCGDGDVRVAAWVVPLPDLELTEGAAEELITDLARRTSAALPAHLRPAIYHVVSEIPLTPRGKLDRDALASLAGRWPAAASPAPAPVPASTPLTETEEVVLGIGEEVLRRRGLRPQDDLFDLGATSLAFTRILLLVNERLGVSLIGSELGETASVAAIAAIADAALRNRQVKALA